MKRTARQLVFISVVSVLCFTYYYWGYNHGSEAVQVPQKQERSSYNPNTIQQPDFLWI